MELNQFLHEHKIELSVALTSAGTALVILTVGGALAGDDATTTFGDIKGLFGNWIYWAMIFGTILLLTGMFYLLDFYFKRKEFYKIFEDKSKSKFIKNQDRIEELAWRLHPKYEEIVIEQKKKWKIR